MHYRKLGRTELMVATAGIDADALRDLERDEAIEALRAALVAGVTVVTWHVADELSDLEPLIAEAAKTELGRFALVPILDRLPDPEELGPQVEAVAARLGSGVDIVAFPDAPTDAHAGALADVRSRGLAQFFGYAGGTALSPAQAGNVEVVLVSGEAPERIAGLGIIALAEANVPGADCTAVPARSAEAVRAAVALAALT